MAPSAWITTTLQAAGLVLVSATAIYASVLLLTRLAGARSFSKLSAFDFAVTVAIGSLLPAVFLTPDPPILQGVVGLITLFGLQALVGVFRYRWAPFANAVDNEPKLLLAGNQVFQEHLEDERITPADLRTQLRKANIQSREDVRAVVLETTGEFSILTGDAEDEHLDAFLLRDVVGVDQVEGLSALDEEAVPSPTGHRPDGETD